VYTIVASKGNEEGIWYWLARCVEKQYKLTQPRHDGDGFLYPTGSYICLSQDSLLSTLYIFL